MGGEGRARGAFLRGVGACYVAAFASLLPQAAGLFGPGGLLPLARWGRTPGEGSPALVRLCSGVGLELSVGLEAACLAGAVLAFAGAAGRRPPSAALLVALYALYVQVFDCGGVFLGFQWDILLMECGFASIFLADPLPWGLLSGGADSFGASRSAGPWLVCRFILFKLMFMSGVVKLTSRCPTWLGLTACHYHWATQPLSTPMAWALHAAPGLLKKLSVATTLLIEIPAPFLMLSPWRGPRLVCAALQVLLQLSIIASGNYCFFNALTLVLTLTLLDIGSKNIKSEVPSRLGGRGGLAGLAFLVFVARYMFQADLPFGEGGAADVRLVMTVDELERALEVVLPLIIVVWVALVSLLGLRDFLQAGAALWGRARHESRGRSAALFAWRAVVAVACPAILVAGILPFATLSDKLSSSIAREYPGVVSVYRQTRPYHISGGYGLFSHMTGVGDSGEGAVVQRPEIEVLGSMDGVKWTPYTFKYKPGPLDRPPSFVAPLQPRLDWQMWFAALGQYHQNPWFLALMYRLVTGSGAVLKLLDETSPFKEAPPKFVKADLYHYTFTSPPDWRAGSRDWWKRTRVREYFPAVSRDNASLVQAVRSIGLLRDQEKSSARGSSGGLELGKRKASDGAKAASVVSIAAAAASACGRAAAARPAMLHAFALLGFLAAWVRILRSPGSEGETSGRSGKFKEE